MLKNKDAIVTLGLKLDRFGNLQPELERRVDVAVSLYRLCVAPVLVMAGSHSYDSESPAVIRIEADAMTARAIDLGVPKIAMRQEAKSLETIGCALEIKAKAEKDGWERLALVTCGDYLKRATRIFRHVLGSEFSVTGIAACKPAETGQKRIYEVVSNLTAAAVLLGTQPGDAEAIKHNLVEVIPEYAAIYPRHGGEPVPATLAAAA
jgi:hypothetical protein